MLMLDISGVPHTPHFAPSRKSANLTSQQSGQSDNLASLAIWPVWQLKVFSWPHCLLTKNFTEQMIYFLV